MQLACLHHVASYEANPTMVIPCPILKRKTATTVGGGALAYAQKVRSAEIRRRGLGGLSPSHGPFTVA